MKKVISFSFLLLAIFSLSAQQGKVVGKVVDQESKPVFGANVVVKSVNKGIQTDMDGNFTIAAVDQGNYTLTVSYVGFKTQELAVAVTANGTADVGTVVLYEGNELLQEVVVTGERRNRFSRKETAYVSKLPLKDLENTHVYTTITNELLTSQMVTNLEDAMNNATGVSKLWEATGRDPLRGTGYFSTRGFSTQPQMVNGLPGVTLSALDPSYIERIEVIKGPSATLFGSTYTSLGGLINVVTKQPYQGKGGSISYTAGSFGLHRASVDVNTPLNQKENMFFRLTSSFLTQDSFQDAGFKRTYFIAPSLTYRVNNRLNLSAGLEYAWNRQTNAGMLFLRRGLPLQATNIDQLNIDPKKSLTSNDIFLTNQSITARAIADYKISDQWTSQTVFAGNFGESYGYYQYNSDGGGAALLPLARLVTEPSLAPLNPILGPLVNPLLAEANALLGQEAFTRIFDQRDSKANIINLQQNFNGDFKVGTVRNRVLVGLDYVRNRFDYNTKNGNPVITSSSNFPQILGFLADPQASVPFPLDPAAIGLLQGTGQQLSSFYNGLPYFDAFFDAQGNVIPTSITPGAAPYPTRGRLDQIFRQVPDNRREFGSETFAAYLSDVIDITDRLTLNVGLRLDHFVQDGNLATDTDDYTKTNFSPNAGVLYQPLKDKLSVFANYQTGFINRDPEIQRDGTVVTFEPQKARQFEGGFKSSFFYGKLNLGASYYHIIVNDRPSTDPRVPLIAPVITLDEVVNKGIELEVNANPLNGLNIRASYAYNNSEITEVGIAELQGRRPEEAGPETVYNLWTDYQFIEGSLLQNFGLGFGFNGASTYNTIDNGISGQFELPSYTVFNASIYYNTPKYRIGLKANNITDEVYYRGWSTINPQQPFNMLGSVTYKF